MVSAPPSSIEPTVSLATPWPGSYSRYATRKPVSVTATAGALAVLPVSSRGTANGPAPTSCIEHPAPTPGSSGFVDGAHAPSAQVSPTAHAPMGDATAFIEMETSRACVTSTTVHPV